MLKRRTKSPEAMPLISRAQSDTEVQMESVRGKASSYQSDGRFADEDDEDSDQEFPHLPRPKRSMRPTSRIRKKAVARSRTQFKHKPRKRRIAFCCLCDEFRLHELVRRLADDKRRGFDPTDMMRQPWKQTMIGDVLHRYTDGYVYTPDSEEPVLDPFAVKDIFVFSYGCVVFWGCRLEEERAFLSRLREYADNEVSRSEFEESSDDMAFVYVADDEGEGGWDSVKIKLMHSKQTIDDNEGAAFLANDVLTLPLMPDVEEKLAISYAMAQSAKLSVFEERCEKKTDEYRDIPTSMAVMGTTGLNHITLGRMIGDLFVQRNEINLHSDILDTPECFWEDDKYEKHYQAVYKYLDIDGRVEILNQRLSMMKELLDVLQSQLDSAHATKLEWIIIWLIVVEVLIQAADILYTQYERSY